MVVISGVKAAEKLSDNRIFFIGFSNMKAINDFQWHAGGRNQTTVVKNIKKEQAQCWEETD